MKKICVICHHLYQSLQRLPALNPNQTSYRETYWSLRLALLHFCTLVLCESISYSPLHLVDLSRPIWKLHIIHLINRSTFHLFIIKGHEYHWVKELSVVLKWASQTKELSGIKTVLIYCSLAVFIFISGAWGAWWVAFLCSWWSAPTMAPLATSFPILPPIFARLVDEQVFENTRPKPAYGRQGLDWIVRPGYSFVVFSTNRGI